MKNYMKWLLGFFALMFVLAGATLAYTKLSLDYVGQQETERSRNSTAVGNKVSNGTGGVEGSTASEDSPQVIDFTMLNEDGETVAFSDLLGKPVILNFWTTWCGPCQMEMPHIQEAYEEYGDEINFVLVNLTDGRRDTVDGVKQFVEDAGYTWPIYFDTESRGAYAYGVYSIPVTYFMNERGEIVSSRLGAMTQEDLQEQIQNILPGRQ